MYQADKNEKEILEFWEKDQTFEKSVSERPEDKPYVFFDGPPFATGLPHYGHLVGTIMKDMVPRYATMRGKKVERVWGWDCHGLPIENIVEKELGSKSKKDIEEMGVGKFNEMCRSKVLTYVEEWEKIIPRLGRWVDMNNAYRTMDIGFMESVWWVFKELWDKDLIYKDYKAMHICPRCETTLSQQEVSEGYKDVKDLSVTAKFKVTGEGEMGNGTLSDIDGDVYFLAWTTTPWTLPGNILLAVGEEIEYVVVEMGNGEGGMEQVILAKELVESVLEGKEYKVVKEVKGSELVGLKYEPLFPYFTDLPEADNGFRVVTADFVTTEDGTGIVHLAPAFGTDDYNVFKKENVPFIQHVKMDGTFVDQVTDFAGLHVKPTEDHMSTDIEIVKWLAHNGKLFSKKKYEHSYPHCWRCDTPLLNYATSSWFVAVTKVKDKALEEAKKINWSPEHIKAGRFGKWLEGARDWSISRQRFWASVMPVWECENSGQRKAKSEKGCGYAVFGSVAELEERSGQKVEDLHKHVVDKITFPCESCGGEMKRIPDVLDTWFDSGSMPYAQGHYPFENKSKFEEGFPAQFIAEGVDQTRAWFYYLHVLATSLRQSPAFENVIVNGIVLAEDGKKMSKKLKNYPDPMKVVEKYGADALRFYLMSSPVVQAENLNFSEDGVREAYTKVVNTLHNVLEFYLLLRVEGLDITTAPESENVLDSWILSKLNVLVGEVTDNMEKYNLPMATRPIMDFVLDLSQWYVRRSRDRFKEGSNEDKKNASQTLGFVLQTLAKVMAPVTPFLAEKVFQETRNKKQEITSVHLEMWPEAGDVDEDVLKDMDLARKFVEMGHSLRKESGLAVRQPLSAFSIHHSAFSEDLCKIIADELNVKKVELVENVVNDGFVVKEDGDYKVALNTELTPELKKEGMLREVVRAVNQIRKEKKLTRDDRANLYYETDSEMVKEVFEKYKGEILSQTRSTDIVEGKGEKPVKLSEGNLKISVE